LKNSTFVALGVLLAAAWSSASTASKVGLHSVEPMVLFVVRFALAGLVLLAWAYGRERQPLPRGREWGQLLLLSLLNTALYLTLFIYALQQVTAGLSSLATALSPLFISVLSAALTRQRVSARTWGAIGLGLAGVGVAAWPLLRTSYATPAGLGLLAASMFVYSAGAVYYARIPWRLSRTAVNGWQTLLAAFLCLPVMLLLHRAPNHFDARFWAVEAWLVGAVSVLAVQLWLRLLKADAVRASLFLFLCPIFGFFFATLLLGEPFTGYTAAGTGLVLVGLWWGQRKG